MVVSTDNNLRAVIQYAVEYLKVKHIIVCSHYEWGGVKATLHPRNMGQLIAGFKLYAMCNNFLK